ncbi:phosphatase PAP2 family protein [Cellulomonas triticagri]|uniref:peptidylprolyl isomerase n=2 Tax=Cellulomonas triticagri TaxID=2483352 RepID=A0A3M2JDH8_9CELL|nr:phosphatase PAP2 family protein [Cellulomonas triticagri]
MDHRTPAGPPPSPPAPPVLPGLAAAGGVLVATAAAVAVAWATNDLSQTVYVSLTVRTGGVAAASAVALLGASALVALVLLVAVLARPRRAVVVPDGGAASPGAGGATRRSRRGDRDRRGLLATATVVATWCAAVVGALVASGLSRGLKEVVREPRGCWELVDVALCPPPGDWSFPSTHTTAAAALATAVVVTVRAARALPPGAGPGPLATRVLPPVAVVLAVLVGAARVAQGAHLPHDVLAGAALGTGTVLAAVLALRPVLVPLATRALPRAFASGAGQRAGWRRSAHDQGDVMSATLPQATGSFGEKPILTFPEGDAPADLQVVVLSPGDGALVEAGDDLEVHYLGQSWKGGVFDNSYDRGSSINFPIGVGAVIGGWDEGLVGQPVGSRVLLSIPPHLGYGDRGVPQAGIKGGDTLVFVVDIVGTR